MEITNLNPKDAKVKLEELEKVVKESRTEEQGKDINQLTEYVKGFEEYSKLVDKDENVLTEQDLNKLIELGDTYAGFVGEDENKQAQTAGEKKKYAGKYETVEDLLKGINSSEEEKKRILENLDKPSVEALETFYKTSQRDVTKVVDIQKKITPPPPTNPAMIDISKIPLQERILEHMTKEEYIAWSKESPLEAQTWLNKATRLSEDRGNAWTKVLTKYPSWVAERHGIIPPSKELIEFNRLDIEKGTNLLKDANAPISLMEEMEKNLGIGGQANNPAPAPKIPKAPEKEPETFIQGKPGHGSGGKGKAKLSAEEFERLTPEKQREYQEGSVNLNE